MPFTPTGYQALTLSEVIAEINAIFVDVFGANVNLDPASPNGQFINNLANVAINNQNFMVLLTSSLYNPDIAASVWLDAICALSGIDRIAASNSYATCVCTGSAGTVIPIDTQISNSNGDIFVNGTSGTIGSSGTIEIIFIAQQTGAVNVDAGTVNNIINKIYGWDSVNNPTNGTVGGTKQNDNSLRSSRSSLLASYGSASLDAIYAKLVATPNVTDVFVAENDTASPVTVSGVTLTAHSIYMAIIGGTDTDVATSIYQKKCPGVNMVGNTTATISTGFGGTYTARFQRPVQVPLQVNISLQNSVTLPSTATIQQTIVNNFNGEDTNISAIQPVKIGQTINVSRFVPSLILIGAENILSMTIQTVTSGTPAAQITLPASEIGTLLTSNVIVTLVG